MAEAAKPAPVPSFTFRVRKPGPRRRRRRAKAPVARKATKPSARGSLSQDILRELMKHPSGWIYTSTELAARCMLGTSDKDIRAVENACWRLWRAHLLHKKRTTTRQRNCGGQRWQLTKRAEEARQPSEPDPQVRRNGLKRLA